MCQQRIPVSRIPSDPTKSTKCVSIIYKPDFDLRTLFIWNTYRMKKWPFIPFNLKRLYLDFKTGQIFSVNTNFCQIGHGYPFFFLVL